MTRKQVTEAAEAPLQADVPTLSFMPHCPVSLHEELLAANACGPDPPQLAVLGNSFRRMAQARQSARAPVRASCLGSCYCVVLAAEPGRACRSRSLQSVCWQWCSEAWWWRQSWTTRLCGLPTR